MNSFRTNGNGDSTLPLLWCLLGWKQSNNKRWCFLEPWLRASTALSLLYSHHQHCEVETTILAFNRCANWGKDKWTISCRITKLVRNRAKMKNPMHLLWPLLMCVRPELKVSLTEIPEMLCMPYLPSAENVSKVYFCEMLVPEHKISNQRKANKGEKNLIGVQLFG